ncbi:fumarylacetoacetate hydrolase family protein [Phytohabitans kaempferiae]|uniref:Fumarylacetoacetate hydrolase family protein n=1 Tax=Phytohabitans kaempferiae TaxID=1620943 RepID=A0ABV6LZ56_9ACTN
MRLATIRTTEGTAAVRVEPGGEAVEIGPPDVGALLALPDWATRAAAAEGRRHAPGTLDHAPLVPRPEKIICVGLNYRRHILEMGRELPEHPTLFVKFPSALVGARDEVTLPRASAQVDWEAELAVVIGTAVRHASPDAAHAAIAGYTVLNDVTARDWQYRTTQWLAGKTFEATTPLGPELVTADEVPAGAGLEITCSVNDEVVQRDSTAELVFDPVTLVAYLSRIVTLRPGDVIATGTPGGVGHARKPPRYLADGDVLVTRVEGVGECRNVCRAEKL